MVDFNRFLSPFKEKTAAQAAPKPSVLTPSALELTKRKVLDYSNRGYSESEIIDALQGEGLTFEQIDQALTAALKSSVSSEAFSPQPGVQTIRKGFDFKGSPYEAENEEIEDLSPISQGVELSISPVELLDKKVEEIEEMVEDLVEEKVTRVEEAVGNIRDAFSKFNDSLVVLQTAMQELQKNIDTVNKEFRDHNAAVDQRFEDFNPRINSLEKAFKDTVPALVDSVREIREMHERDSGKKDKKESFSPYH